ncbi:MAG: hypothetical protein LCH43_11485 [Actinobacteria bacterium]|nr:hypothetical protein [Actinomycetota bacterium]
MSGWVCPGCKIRAERIAEAAGGVWMDYVPREGHLLHIGDSLVVAAPPSAFHLGAAVAIVVLLAVALIGIGLLIGGPLS